MHLIKLFFVPSFCVTSKSLVLQTNSVLLSVDVCPSFTFLPFHEIQFLFNFILPLHGLNLPSYFPWIQEQIS